MKKYLAPLVLAVALMGTTSTSGCGSTTATVAQDTQQTAADNFMSQNQLSAAQGSADAYNRVHIVVNGEQENIRRYVQETTDPGMISYVVLFTLGRPIGYYTAKGPITDCNKELTPNQHPAYVYVNGSSMDYTADSPNDEGTYGSNIGSCHFFYTEDGQLIRWTGEFLASDKPVRLSEKPLVINVESAKYGAANSSAP